MMATKVFSFVFVLTLFISVKSQCLNRLPNCCNQNQNFIPVDMLQNQVLVNQPFLTPVNQPIIADSCDPFIPAVAAPTTIVQDSTVANNLANALQLLVVSSLLSNTLPNANPFVAPYLPAGPIMPPCGNQFLGNSILPGNPCNDQLGPGGSPYYVY